MTKKLIATIIVLLVFILAMGAYTYAVWLEQFEQTQNYDQSAGIWRESQKYIVYKPVYAEGDTAHDAPVGLTVWDYTGIVNERNYLVEIPEKYIDAETGIIMWETNTAVAIDPDAGLPVIAISSNMRDNPVIRELRIPSAMKLIEENAFTDCRSLTTVTIYVDTAAVDAKKMTIEMWAFSSCQALTTLRFWEYGYNGAAYEEVTGTPIETLSSIAVRFSAIGENAFFGAASAVTNLVAEIRSAI
jgi:hypothetical protein